jgi:hypothetical protein
MSKRNVGEFVGVLSNIPYPKSLLFGAARVGEMTNVQIILDRKLDGKQQLGRPRRM